MAKVRQVEIREAYNVEKHTGGTNNEPFMLFALSTIFWPIAFARMFSKGKFLMFLGSLPFAYFSYMNGFYISAGIWVAVTAFIVWFVRFLKTTTI